MRLLIDTHCWLWAMAEPQRLPSDAKRLIQDETNTIFLSSISALEIAIKFALRKLNLPAHPNEYIPSRVSANRMNHLPVYVTHALRVGELPRHHNDPFDRVLIAQSQIEELPLMTADAVIAQYDVDIIWAGHGRQPRRGRARK